MPTLSSQNRQFKFLSERTDLLLFKDKLQSKNGVIEISFVADFIHDVQPPIDSKFSSFFAQLAVLGNPRSFLVVAKTSDLDRLLRSWFESFEPNH